MGESETGFVTSYLWIICREIANWRPTESLMKIAHNEHFSSTVEELISVSTSSLSNDHHS